MRIFITGACGFVGGHLAYELARAYPNALLFGMAHAQESRAGLPPGVHTINADLTNRESVRASLEIAQPDIVFHLAGFASAAGGDRDKIFRVNVDGTTGLLELLTERQTPCRVHLASSGYVYGTTDPTRPAQENEVPHPSGVYAESKWAMEQAAHSFADNGLLSLTVTRSFNHTGPRQTTDFVLPAFARQIARIERGQEPPVVKHGNLDALRDFLHVRDVVRAYRLLLCETAPQPWRRINVCSGQGVAIRDLLEQLVSLSRVPVTLETDPSRLRPSDMPQCVGDPSFLEETTGWRPEIPLSQTMQETLDWWRAQAD